MIASNRRKGERAPRPAGRSALIGPTPATLPSSHRKLLPTDPALQNTGVGRRLMQAVIDRARERGIASVRLVQAAYHGRSLSLYTKLGFDAREPLSIMQGPALGLAVDG